MLRGEHCPTVQCFHFPGFRGKVTLKMKWWLRQSGTEDAPKAIPETGSDVQL